MRDPYISVAMITYNQEQYIAQAIESILKQQTEVPFELVIGEDCSTDETRAIVMDYSRRFPDIIRVIASDKNVGMMANLMRTIRACRGRYVAFCEGDDYWLDEKKLHKQLMFMRDHPEVSMSFHAVRLIYADKSRPPESLRYHRDNKILTDKEVILGGGGIFKFTSTMFRGDVLADLPPWCEEAPITDVPLALLALSKGRVAYMDEVMSSYRVHVANSWTMRKHRSYDKRLEYIKNLAQTRKDFDQYTDYRHSTWLIQRISRNYRQILLVGRLSIKRRRRLYEQFKDDMLIWDRLIVLICCYIDLPGMRGFLVRALRRRLINNL